MYLIVKTDLDPLSLVGAVREAVTAADNDQPISEIRTMEGVLSDQFAGQRFNTLLVGIFAAIALMLVTAGVYGVVSFYVAQSTHEIGVRMALGAGRARVLGLTLLRGLKLAAVGGAVGVAGIFATTTVIRSLLFGASPVDIPTMIGGALVLLGVAVLASLVPAHRAASVSPVTALRIE
jgi:ABC-type antimicrobial peptide transport system permease subunit